MQVEPLTQLKRQIHSLDADAKKQLAEFLSEELETHSTAQGTVFTDQDRRDQTEWLKNNRERYANKYVALYRDELVGEGSTRSEAKAAAHASGYPNAFVTYVYSENEEVFGGW